MSSVNFQDLRKTNEPLMEQLVQAAEAVIRSGRYINGQYLGRFEAAMQQRLGAPFCIGVSTGLDALRLILQACIELGRLKPGDEVIIPANTFIATFLAVTHCGLTAVAADVDEDTFCLDYDRLPLSPATNAIIPVHLFGRVCLDEVEARKLREKGLIIIEDCAQAIGAKAPAGISGENIMAGTLADAAAISFYPAKNVGALGDAGAVLTADPLLAKTVRQLANYGAEEKYHHTLCGFNCRMDELQAAMLLPKLEKLEEIGNRRRERASLYNSLISNPDIILPHEPEFPESHVWHQYVVRHPRRDALRLHLQSKGVGTEIHYPVPCHLQECYKGHPLLKTPSPLPVAERLAKEILSLPIADVSKSEIREIADIINSF